MTRKLVAIGIALSLGFATAGAQQSPYRSVRVRSCPYADSVLGPLRDDFRGAVRAFHHRERDSTYLVTDNEGKRPTVTSSSKLAGKGPTRDPAVQLAVYLRGGEAQVVAATAEKGPVDVTLVLDDSVTIAPASTALGRFEGPKEMMTLPASALLVGAELIAVAQARSIVVNAGPVPVKVSNDDRRALRALVRVALCPS